MKIIFAGTPKFAIPTLEILINSSHEISTVYTQPDRPAGRGQKLKASPVKQWALTHNLPVYQPTTLKDPGEQKKLQEFVADIFIDVAYGLFLPKEILDIPKFGCINIHPSLLPNFRGAAPIQRAIISGVTTTGVTIMKIDTGLDTGDIYKQKTLNIDSIDTTETLLEKTAIVGAQMLLEVLREIENGTAKTVPQDNEKSTYAHKITKEEGKIAWHKSAEEIARIIRAFNPWPIAYTQIEEKYVRIWQAEVISNEQPFTNYLPGSIIKSDKHGIAVATGKNILRLLKIQLPGGKPLSIQDILNAHHEIFEVGKKFM